MHITYQNPGFDSSMESIMRFQTDEQTPFWSDGLFVFYPQIDRNEFVRRNLVDRKTFLYEAFSKIYQNAKGELEAKTGSYQAHFMKYKDQIEDALSDAFELDSRAQFNDLTANLTLNPVSPRFLKEHSFDVFYLNSERGALGVSMHEVIHFFWFSVWNRHFRDDYAEYENPSLKWILSEMVVEAIMSDQRLSSINPYFPRENGGCVYSYFQNMVIDGTPILERISALYRNNNITDFMEASYADCLRHENAIRRHIAQEETSF